MILVAKTELVGGKVARCHNVHHKSHTDMPSGVVLKLLSFFVSLCFFLSADNNEGVTSQEYKDFLYILVGRSLELAVCTKLKQCNIRTLIAFKTLLSARFSVRWY
jgi:hypothetical protein